MRIAAILLAAVVAACTPSSPAPSSGTSAPPAAPKNVLGQAIPAGAADVSLASIAKDPKAYVGKTITTTGTVTAVCQHMGCWMEVKDDVTQAHVSMAGHGFFVPKNASGRKARVQGTLTRAPDEESECNEEAAKQMGKPVAKLQLEATGIELD
jgi:Rieske Fe-S protein